MLVVHGVWAGDGLAFWGERPAAEPAGQGVHPYAAPAPLLCEVLAIDEGDERELPLLLPGSAKEPLPSPGTGRPVTAARPRLRVWRVPAVVPPLPVALRAVEGYDGSATVRHWAAVAGLARDLVRRGRVIPRLVAEGGAGRAVWEPLVTRGDAAYVKELALAMPPACRTSEVERPSGEVLWQALMAFTDTLVREALTDPLVERPATARARWLAALTGPDPSCPDVPGLREDLERWRESILDAEGPTRVCFRLLEPAAEDATVSGGDPAGDGTPPADGRPGDASTREPTGTPRAEGGGPAGTPPAQDLAAHRGAHVAGVPEGTGTDGTGGTGGTDGPDGTGGTGGPGGTGGTGGPAAGEPDTHQDHRHATAAGEPDFFPGAFPGAAGSGATGAGSADGVGPRGGDGAVWGVEVALQGVEDPSLYVPAAQVWAGEYGGGERVLLAGLGRAVRLYPELERALRTPEPRELVLDTAGAFRFLKEAAPLLQAAGFGVLLPRWAGRNRLGLKVTARRGSGPGAVAGQGLGLRDLVDFRVDLAVAGETIGEAELAELARLKVPLVRVRGRWVELDERQLAAALRVVGGGRTGTVAAAELLRQVVRDDGELPLLEVDADGVLGDLLSGEAERRLRPIGTPAGIDAVLRPYQERGLAWLAFLSELGLGGVLADDMGLGKTITTLALLVHEKAGREEAGREKTGCPTLLVCPMSLLGNWQREAARFAPGLRVYTHHGQNRDPARIADADLVLTTYGTAQRDLEALREVAWRRVVCDEAQAIKNSGTLQARAVRAIPAEHRLALTGTPVENHLAELWSIMEFVNPGLLGPRAGFRERFQEPIEARQDEQAARALKRATGPFILRRVKTDKSVISDLPEKLEIKEWCPLTAEQASLYQAVVDDMLARIEGSEGIERRGLVLAAMARLKQVCNHPAHLLKDGSRLAGRSGKLQRLEELAEEILAEGEKALLFTQYAEFGAMLQPYLERRLERPVLWLHGGLPRKARDRLVDRFQRDEEPMLFLLSLKAAGVGLNLTAASHVVHVDRWWNPAVEDQATDRAFRIGQRRNVQVRKLICAGTLEERVDAMIERKKALAEQVVGTGEDWLTDLSTQELREVFRLTSQEVA